MRHTTVSDISMTMQVGPSGGWSLNAIPCAIHEAGTEWVVRRLTPLECLRLQGFDDDWLDDVRVAGKPLTDSDRLRMIGNSWPVPVAAWLLERLLAHVEAEKGGSTQG
jgi:site-specific DNA-cytosine methylase